MSWTSTKPMKGNVCEKDKDSYPFWKHANLLEVELRDEENGFGVN